MKNHPLSELFPMMGNSEIQELSEDIKKNGLKNPIITYEGKILDGRNRYAACKLAFIEPDTEEYTGNNPLEYIVSLNLHRRHLSESQRGVIAGKIATMKKTDTQFKNGVSDEISGCANLRTPLVSQGKSAEMLNVSRRTVQNVQKIMREAPDKIPDIESGKKTINKAMEEMKENKTSVEKKLGGNISNKPRRIGSFDDWKVYREKAKQVLAILKEMSCLKVDADRIFQARQYAEEMQNQITKILKQN